MQVNPHAFYKLNMIYLLVCLVVYLNCGCVTPTTSETGGEPVKQLFALLSTHGFGDTGSSVLSLLLCCRYESNLSD